MLMFPNDKFFLIMIFLKWRYSTYKDDTKRSEFLLNKEVNRHDTTQVIWRRAW